jgi:hypothetical protein
MVCPLLPYVSVDQRIKCLVPDCTGTTTINSIWINGKILQIDNPFTQELFRAFCFGLHEIGNKSLRPGAAIMSLFLHNVLGDRVMTLGSWASQAFLDYIWPKVLEWTNSMSQTMIQTDSFLDALNCPVPPTQ